MKLAHHESITSTHFRRPSKNVASPTSVWKYLAAVAALSLISLPSCATSGREFPVQFGWVTKGRTQQKDVKLMLGNPQFIGSSDGVPVWTFGYYRYRLFSPSYTKEIKFYWNPDNTLQSYSFNSSFPDDIAGVTPLPARPSSDVSR